MRLARVFTDLLVPAEDAGGLAARLDIDPKTLCRKILACRIREAEWA